MFDFTLPSLDWREVSIRKAHGDGYRHLCIPNDELKKVQRQILEYLYTVKGLRPSYAAHGFVPFRNTSSGAAVHDKLSPVIVCMDVKSFFDTFPVEPVKEGLIEAGVPAVLVDKILQACTYKGHFPQGSPCSPHLTNIGMRKADRYLSMYAYWNGMRYSRYADDLTFSLDPGSGKTPRKSYKAFYRTVDGILQKLLGIRLNWKKSHCIRINSGKAKRRVTGVVIRKDGHGYNAPREMRDLTRARLNNLYKKVRHTPGIMSDGDRIEFHKIEGAVRYLDAIRRASFTQADRKAAEEILGPDSPDIRNLPTAVAARPDTRINREQLAYLKARSATSRR